MTAFRDITGQRFGQLTAIRCIERGGPNKTLWSCVCDCGVETIVSLNNLGRATNSCGCLKRMLMRKTKTKPLVDVIVVQAWNAYTRNARNRKLSWDLTKEEFKTLIMASCAYCGASGKPMKVSWTPKWIPRRSLPTNGVDRKDNTLGYISTNCLTACKRCNFAKNDMTTEEFLAWARRLVSFQDA